MLENGKLVPVLIQSNDAGRTFEAPRRIDLSVYEAGFDVVPGFTRPVVDVGGHFHAPIHVRDGKESVALNYVVREDALVEAIRVRAAEDGPSARYGGVAKISQEVFRPRSATPTRTAMG